jgi:hypothetical protein
MNCVFIICPREYDIRRFHVAWHTTATFTVLNIDIPGLSQHMVTIYFLSKLLFVVTNCINVNEKTQDVSQNDIDSSINGLHSMKSEEREKLSARV